MCRPYRCTGCYHQKLWDNSVSNTYVKVDALIDALRSELGNQIDNDGDGYTEDGGDCNAMTRLLFKWE